MKLGIIAGNRQLPLVLTQAIKRKIEEAFIVAICFKGETMGRINKLVDKSYWIQPDSLSSLKTAIKKDDIKEWIMAGQINPLRIFKPKRWDEDLAVLAEQIEDFRPHKVFKEIITHLENEGIKFLDSTFYLKEYLAGEGVMNGLCLNERIEKDIEFGRNIASRFIELDIGQTVVVKNRSVVACESLEGTDRTIKRAAALGGAGCTVLKFSKLNQDERFDVPLVGISTLKLLKRIRAASLVLEKERVIILEKERFLFLAKKWKIPVVG